MRLRPYLQTSAAVVTTAAVGSVGTDVDSRWYLAIDKPRWQPPGPVFGVAWTVLYGLLAASGGRSLSRPQTREQRRAYTWAYGLNLALNAGWSWSFFRARRPALALAEAAALQASTLDLTRRTWRIERAAGAGLLPYAVWTSFATALTASIARRNPGGKPPRRRLPLSALRKATPR